MEERFDVVVLGCGPSGQHAATRCARAGKRVALVDEREVVGGQCLHVGTIPSKTLRAAILHALAKSPADRPRDAGAFAEELHRIIDRATSRFGQHARNISTSTDKKRYTPQNTPGRSALPIVSGRDCTLLCR